MVQDDELSAPLDVARIVFGKTLVETLVGLDQAQNVQAVPLQANTPEQKESLQQQGVVQCSRELRLWCRVNLQRS